MQGNCLITYPIFLIFQRTHLSNNAAVLNNNLLRSTTVGKFIPTKRNKSDDGDRRPKTLELQNQLGNLPVPNINDTIAKFLITTKPLLSNEEFATTAKSILQLAQPNGLGEKLQNILLKRRGETDNWV